MKKELIIITLLLLGSVFSLFSQKAPFTLPTLPYTYNALEPAIDAQTMEIHYTKHHAAYVKNLNAAVKGTKWENSTLDELMLNASQTGDAIRNNAGGHYNHSLYWTILGLNKPFDPTSEVGKAVIAAFGTVDSLKRALNKAGATRFGSGWAWLYVTKDKKLAVCSSSNQDNPIMDISAERGIPILAIDVWEHAYYLKYQNRRGDYLAAILDIINWEAVNANYKAALESPLLKEIGKNK
jgi:superoxide dismutase